MRITIGEALNEPIRQGQDISFDLSSWSSLQSMAGQTHLERKELSGVFLALDKKKAAWKRLS